MSSRLDRNLITVITGQTVDAFDQLFRYLYMTSSFVDLHQVATEPEPEPDTRHQVLSVAPPSAAIARKLHNPKYALVALSSPSPVNLNSNDSPKEPEVSEDPKTKKQRKITREDLPQDAPPLHPGLIDLEKVSLLSYLPTWPEPDPPSDVIGFINIRDSKKPTQVHLQRSEMFETSQAIKFSSPFSKPDETLPEVAIPRNRIAQNESKTKDLSGDNSKPEQKCVGLVDNNNQDEAPEQKSQFFRQTLNTDKSETKVVQMENKLCPNMATDADSGPLCCSPDPLPQSSIKGVTPKHEQSSIKGQVVSTTSSKPLTESKNVKELEIPNALKAQTFVETTNTAQKFQLHKQTQLKTEDTEEKNMIYHQDLHTNTADTQTKISSEKTFKFQIAQNESKIEDLLVDKAKPQQKSGGLVDNINKEMAPEPKTQLFRQKLVTDKNEINVDQLENRLCSNMTTGLGSPCLSSNALPQSVNKASKPEGELPTVKTQVFSTTSSEPLRESKKAKEPEILTVSKPQSTLVDKKNTTQKAQLHKQTQLKTEDTEEKNIVYHKYSHKNAADTQPQVSYEKTLNIQIAQRESKNENLLVDKPKPEQKNVGLVDNRDKEMAPEQKSLLREKLNQGKSESKAVQMENKLCSNMASAPDLDPLFPCLAPLPQSSIKALTPKKELPSLKATVVSTTSSEPLKESKNVKAPEINQQSTFLDPTNTAQKSQIHKPTQLNTEKRKIVHQDSLTETADTQPNISSEKSYNAHNPGRPGHTATSAAPPMQSEPFTSSPSTFPPCPSSFPTLPLLQSSASSFTTSSAPDLNLLTHRLFKQDSIKSDNKKMLETSVVKNFKTSSGPQIVNAALESLVQVSPAKNLESTPELQRKSISKTEDQNPTESRNIPKNIKQELEMVTFQMTKGKEPDEKNNGKAEVESITKIQLETQSDVSIKGASNTPKDVDLKTQRDCITTKTIDTSDKTLTNLEFAKTNKTQTYLARCHEPQIISYCNFTSQDVNMVKPLDSLTAAVNCVSHNPYTPGENSDCIKSTASILSQPDKQAQVPSVDCTDITLNSIKQHTHNAFQEQAGKTQGSAYASRKTLHLHLSNVQVADLSLQTNKQELQLPASVVVSPAPKVFPQNLLTPDSRTTSPDPRTPTTDISDGYFSPREDSTTSEEYFECNESPSPVLDTSGCRNHGVRENNSPTYTDRTFSRNIDSSPADLDNVPSGVALASASQSTSSSESSTKSLTSRKPPASLPETKWQTRESEITNKRNSIDEAKIETKSSNTDKKKEQVHQSTDWTDDKELNQMPGPLKSDSYLKEMALKLRKTSGRQDDGGMTDIESEKKGTRRLSAGEFKPDRVLSEEKKAPSGKDKSLNQEIWRLRQPTRETTGQKPSHPSPKSQPRQQPSSRGSSPSRVLRYPRTPASSQVQGARSGFRDLNQTESKALQSNSKESDNKPPPRRSQSRSPSPLKAAPAGSGSGRKQVYQRLLTRQPPAAQIRSKADQVQIQTAKQQATTLHTLSHQVPPHASNDKVSEKAAHEPEEGRVSFNLSFSRLYNFKGLRDKFTKQPTPSRSSDPPVKGRKSTN